MANTWYYVDGSGSSHTIYLGTGADTTLFVQRNSETGWEGPEAEVIIEQTPDRMTNQYRTTVYGNRTYGIQVLLKGSTKGHLETLRANWADWHRRELGEGYIRRVTHRGTQRDLDCIPLRSEWGPDPDNAASPITCVVTQTYLAAMPWWRSTSQSSAAGTFGGTTAVNVTCGNPGEIPTYPVITITGIVNKPMITVGSDHIQINSSSGSSTDQFIIDCRPVGTTRRTAKFHQFGSSVGTFVTITSSSKYVTLPVGTTGVSIVASAGTAAKCLFEWYTYYESLY